MNNKTFMAKAETVERKWFIVDADGVALGRLASGVASVLRGKTKAVFTPHCDTGDYVIVINCDKVMLTGKKLDTKFTRTYSGHPGGLKEMSYRKYIAEKSDEAVYEAVQGMLPKGPLGRKMIKKLRVYKGAEHEHAAQAPAALKF